MEKIGPEFQSTQLDTITLGFDKHST